MPATVIVVQDATVQFGDVASGVNYACQVTSAAIQANPNLLTVPATGCQGETQVPAATGFDLVLTWLQDWGQAAPASLSQYLFDNDTLEVEFLVSLDTDEVTMPVASGTVRLVAGAYGGDFGTPLTATATLPVQGKPTIGPAALTAFEDRTGATAAA
jgi:hypothetical protein